MPIDELIYDVGMNNGDDTSYYLSLGFRTGAIEANLKLVEQANSVTIQPDLSNEINLDHSVGAINSAKRAGPALGVLILGLLLNAIWISFLSYLLFKLIRSVF